MPYTNINDAIARLDEIEATASAYGHAMGEWTVTQEATCAAEGESQSDHALDL